MAEVYKLFINPKDTEDDPLTYDRLINWLVDTGWVEGNTSKQMSPLDKKYEEDYIQEVWVQILSVPHDKLMEIWYKGKGRFVNYIKTIIRHNCYSTNSPLYNNVRACRKGEIYLEDSAWNRLTEEGVVNYDKYIPVGKGKNIHFESEQETTIAANKLYE